MRRLVSLLLVFGVVAAVLLVLRSSPSGTRSAGGRADEESPSAGTSARLFPSPRPDDAPHPAPGEPAEALPDEAGGVEVDARLGYDLMVRAAATDEVPDGAVVLLLETQGQNDPGWDAPVVRRWPVGEDGEVAVRFGTTPPWGYLEVQAPGHVPKRIAIAPWGHGRHARQIWLRPAGCVRGRVVRADGRSVDGVLVGWVDLRDGGQVLDVRSEAEGPRPVRTDAQGAFRLDGLFLDEPVLLRARAPDGARGEATGAALGGDVKERFLEIPVAAAGAVRGRLLRPDGRPYRGGRLYLRRLHVHGTREDHRELSLEPGGRIVIDRLLPGRWALTYRHDALRPEGPPIGGGPFAVRSGAVTDLGDVVPGSGLAVTGRVELEDGPWEDAHALRLKLFGPGGTWWAHTEAGGRFRFDDLDAGSWNLEVDSEGYRFARPVVVEAGAVGQVLGAHGPSCALRLRVRTEAGEDVEAFDAYVVDDGPPGSPWRQQVSGEDGYLHADGLPPGRYVVAVEASGRALWRQAGVVLAPGETRDLEAVLEPAPRLRRRVLSPEGTPVGGALVTLTYATDIPLHAQAWRSAHVDMDHREAETDAAGLFDLAIERPDLVLAAQAEGYGGLRLPVGDVPAGDLVLPPGYEVRGRLEDERGHPLPAAALRLEARGMRWTDVGQEQRTRHDGSFRFPDVAPGAWDLLVLDLRNAVVDRTAVMVADGDVDLGAVCAP